MPGCSGARLIALAVAAAAGGRWPRPASGDRRRRLAVARWQGRVCSFRPGRRRRRSTPWTAATARPARSGCADRRLLLRALAPRHHRRLPRHQRRRCSAPAARCSAPAGDRARAVRLQLGRRAARQPRRLATPATTPADRCPMSASATAACSRRGGWSFSADLGLMAHEPRQRGAPGRVLSGAEASTTPLRDLRLTPVLQLGVSYSLLKAARAHGRRRPASAGACRINLAFVPTDLWQHHERRSTTHRRPGQEQPRRAVHEGHGAVPDVRLLRPRDPDPQGLRRARPDDRQRARGRGVRQGIKDYANWPTIPQLYVNGEFVGGSDIMMEMYQSGELQQAARRLSRLVAAAARHRLRSRRIVVGVTGATGAVYARAPAAAAARSSARDPPRRHAGRRAQRAPRARPRPQGARGAGRRRLQPGRHRRGDRQRLVRGRGDGDRARAR